MFCTRQPPGASPTQSSTWPASVAAAGVAATVGADEGMPPRAIAGAETAGIPFAAWLAELSGLDMRYVRKRPLGLILHGMGEVSGGELPETYLDGLALLRVQARQVVGTGNPGEIGNAGRGGF